MRTISLIIVHCSAVKPNQTSSAKEIDKWHRTQGWKMIGYHYVIRRNGTVEQGRPEWMVGAHCQSRACSPEHPQERKSHNAHSIGVCYEGGLSADGRPADTRTEAQRSSLFTLLSSLKKKYPNAIITGHNALSSKACPCFDATNEYRKLSELKAN